MIIFTSLAPSPIAKVTTFGFYNKDFNKIYKRTLVLTKDTTSYFYFGETRQAMTAFDLSAISITLIKLKAYIIHTFAVNYGLF